MTDITMYARRGEKRDDVDVTDYVPQGNAEPTSRLLDCDMEDCWAAEEWREEGTINNEPCAAYYLFDKSEIIDDKECPLEADRYPWDNDHIRRIIIREGE